VKQAVSPAFGKDIPDFDASANVSHRPIRFHRRRRDISLSDEGIDFLALLNV